MSSDTPAGGTEDRFHTPATDARVSRSSTFRALAILSGVLLVWSFLSVFHYVTDVAGGVGTLVIVVAMAFAAATMAARFVPVGLGLWMGLGLFVLGVGTYLVLIPGLLGQLFTVSFLLELVSYLSGISVLQFLRVDLWAVAVAPAPVFGTWYFLLAREYDLAALAGGLTVAFFSFTGDAGSTTTVAGMVGLFGVLGFGTLEAADGTWRQLERVTLIALLGLVAARIVGSSEATGRQAPSGDGPTVESSLLYNDDNVQITGSISLSPEVRFTVEATRPSYWRVGAYDRYTGDSWLRTGSDRGFYTRLDDPVGESYLLEQTYTIHTSAPVVPAAWKPVSVDPILAQVARVTALGGFTVDRALDAGTEYTVESQEPARATQRLQSAGSEYPDRIADRYLRVPDSTPDRVGEFAAEVAAGASTPFEQAQAIQGWLVQNKNYSLTVNRPDGHIVDGFVFDMRAGYCTYFASAMTVLLRTLDVPARFVVGYTTGESVGDSEWVVRGFNSHAWVEVFFPGEGWIPFDPTPGTARAEARNRRLERARRQGAEGVDTERTDPNRTPTPSPTPTETVVTPTPADPEDPDYNGTFTIPDQETGTPAVAEDEIGVGGGVTGNATATTGGLNVTEPGGIAGFFAKRDRLTVLGSLAALVLGVDQLDAIERLSRRRWLHFQEPTDDPVADIERAFERVEFLLAKRHRDRDPGETPREYLDAVGASDHRLETLLTLYERAHYAREATAEEAREAIELADALVKPALGRAGI